MGRGAANPTAPSAIKEARLSIWTLRDREMEDARPVAWVFFGFVLAVLLIACANVAGLMMARGAGRLRELAVRSAIGASRGRLIRQALTEALVLSFAGGLNRPGKVVLRPDIFRCLYKLRRSSRPAAAEKSPNSGRNRFLSSREAATALGSWGRGCSGGRN